jgi:hypothetical protein
MKTVITSIQQYFLEGRQYKNGSVKMFRAILLFLLVITRFHLQAQVEAQENVDQLRTVVSPTPNASAIARYSEWPVNLYTGLPTIDIPVYTFKSRDVSLPISISYHAGGNRVTEIASWVGLGWSLQGGGVITRSVRGLKHP